MESPKILIVEDDPDIAELLAVSFRKEGWPSLNAENGEKALALIEEGGLDLCVLDLMLPGMDGLAVLRTLRSRPKSARLNGAALPVIIASARGEEADIVAGLDLGADDYIAKPFSPKVLIARIRSLLRRAERTATQGGTEASDGERLDVGGILLDPLRHEVVAHGQPVDLSATEFAFLELLMREPGRVFTRSQAIAKAKGEDYPVTDRSLDVHILSLRRKLGEEGGRIETVRGIGYRFREKP